MTDEGLHVQIEEGPPLPTAEIKGGLGAKARSAVVWNTAFNLFRDFLQFVTMLVLVRLLAPASYGEFGMTNSIVGFLSVFGFGLFVAHSLQVQSDDQTRYQEHFTAGAVLNGGLFVVTNIVAGVLWWIPHFAAVAPFVHAMSITFLLEWPCELRRKMLERQLDWKRHRLLHASGLLASSTLAAALALLGFGTWALLLPGLLVTIPFTYDLFFVQRWRPTWQFSWREYRPAFQFGVTRIASGISSSSRVLLESSVLSVVLGFSGLGIYTRAVGLATMFCGKVASQLLYAIYPVLTRVEKYGASPTRTGDLIFRFIAWTSIPVAVVLGSLAAPVVRILYGTKWDAVIPLLPWTMAMGVLAALVLTANNLLLARQQATLCLIIDVGYLAGTAICLLAAVRSGPVGYVAGLLVVLSIELLLLLHWLIRAQGATWNGLATAVLPPVVVSGCASLVIRVLSGSVHSGKPSMFVAVALGMAFLAVYAAGIRFVFRRPLEAIVNVLPAKSVVRRLLLLAS